jgi:hypothetical protein
MFSIYCQIDRLGVYWSSTVQEHWKIATISSYTYNVHRIMTVDTYCCNTLTVPCVADVFTKYVSIKLHLEDAADCPWWLAHGGRQYSYSGIYRRCSSSCMAMA